MELPPIRQSKLRAVLLQTSSKRVFGSDGRAWSCGGPFGFKSLRSRLTADQVEIHASGFDAPNPGDHGAQYGADDQAVKQGASTDAGEQDREAVGGGHRADL